ncbi:MAG: hypothetical protein ACN4E2_04285 [Nitrospinota bacterium]
MIKKRIFNRLLLLSITTNRTGIVLLTSLAIISIVSMLALFVAATALSEQRLSFNSINKTRAFLLADEGLTLAQARLNADLTGSSLTTYLTTPPTTATGSATSFYCQGCGGNDAGGDPINIGNGPWLDGGITVAISELPAGAGRIFAESYRVTLWDNDESLASSCGDTDPAVDCDGLAIIRSVGTISLPNGNPVARSVQEITFSNRSMSIPTGGLSEAQSGGGSSKSGTN